MVRTHLRIAYVTLLFGWLFGIGFAAGQSQNAIPKYASVVDQAHVLSTEEISDIEQHLSRYEVIKGTQMAVLIVRSTKPESIEQFANRVGNNWRLGRINIGDGVILLLAIDDHTSRIEVSRALESWLTDIQAHRILDEYVSPKFAKSDYANGIKTALFLISKSLPSEKLPRAMVEKTQLDSTPSRTISMLAPAIVYSVCYLFLMAAAVMLCSIPYFGIAAAIAISLMTGVITLTIATSYSTSALITKGAGLATSSLMAMLICFFAYKFRLLLKRAWAKRSPMGFSVKFEVDDGTHPSTPARSNAKSKGGGDFAGGGANDKW
jgi:uncharacterized protein